MQDYHRQMIVRHLFFGTQCRVLMLAALVVVLGGCAGVRPRGQTDLPYPCSF